MIRQGSPVSTSPLLLRSSHPHDRMVTRRACVEHANVVDNCGNKTRGGASLAADNQPAFTGGHPQELLVQCHKALSGLEGAPEGVPPTPALFLRLPRSRRAPDSARS